MKEEMVNGFSIPFAHATPIENWLRLERLELEGKALQELTG
jgi:hypothetical protein